MRRIVKFLLFLLLSLLISCSSEKTGEVGKQGQPEPGANVTDTSAVRGPQSGSSGPYSIEITPLNATRSSTLRLTPKGFDLSDAKVEWLVNGVPAENPVAGEFKAAETRKGDEVLVKANVRGMEVVSNTVRIGNSPPEIGTIRFMPPVDTSEGAILNVEVTGKDPDGDEVTFTYEWTKNGVLAGNESKIEVPLTRGDRFSVRVIPFDGEEYGRPAMVNREIGNLAPRISSVKRTGFDGKVLTYQTSASDVDGDTLTYSLKSGPPGMTVEAATGAIRWEVPKDFRGKASFIVAVSDGHGGESTREQGVEITAVQPAPSK